MTFIYPILLGVIAYVYIHILLQPGMIFGNIAQTAYESIVNTCLGERDWKYKFIFKPFFDCSRCFAGQLGLWGYFGYIYGYIIIEGLTAYNPIIHIYWICVSILTAYIIEISIQYIHYDKKIKELQEAQNKLKNHENKTHLSKKRKRPN